MAEDDAAIEAAAFAELPPGGARVCGIERPTETYALALLLLDARHPPDLWISVLHRAHRSDGWIEAMGVEGGGITLLEVPDAHFATVAGDATALDATEVSIACKTRRVRRATTFGHYFAVFVIDADDRLEDLGLSVEKAS